MVPPVELMPIQPLEEVEPLKPPVLTPMSEPKEVEPQRRLPLHHVA
jgi:hypothetical protein